MWLTLRGLTRGILRGIFGIMPRVGLSSMSESKRLENEHKHTSDLSRSESLADTAEFLRWNLDTVQEQIRFADTKAAFVAIFHTVLLGLVATQTPEIDAYNFSGRCLVIAQYALLVGYAGCALVSVAYVVSAVIPRFGTQAPHCKIFFGHIATKYGRNFDDFHQQIVGSRLEDWIRDLTSQILENSNIALAKHQRVGTAARWALAAVVLAVASTLCQMIA